MTSRSYVWTLFDYGDPEDILRKLEASTWIRYSSFQEERCEETGRTHLQGYSEFNQSTRRNRIKDLLGNGLHCESRRGSRGQARDYTRKAETRIGGPWEHGNWTEGGQGTRNDLTEIKTALDTGEKARAIAEGWFGTWIIHHKAFDKYRGMLVEPRAHKTELAVHWGCPGTGKTRDVFSFADNLGFSVYVVPRPNGGSVWFDGYEQEEVILLDDFYGWIPLNLLLSLADRYPLKVPYKGGHVEFTSKVLFITSNSDLSSWYDWEKFPTDLRRALERRITVKYHYPDPVTLGWTRDPWPDEYERRTQTTFNLSHI